MGGAPPRTRSPAARGAPRAGGACAVPAAAAPGHRLRGTGEPWPLRAAVFSGSWASSCCPLPSRLGGRAPSESPARRRRSRGRLHVASAPPPPPPAPRPAPPGSGECLAAGAPDSLRGAPPGPSASVRSGAPLPAAASSRPPQPLGGGVLSAVPGAPTPRPSPLRSPLGVQPGPAAAPPLPPSLVASFVGRLPPGPSPLGPRSAPLFTSASPLGCQIPRVSEVGERPWVVGGCGTSEAAPRVRGQYWGCRASPSP